MQRSDIKVGDVLYIAQYIGMTPTMKIVKHNMTPTMKIVKHNVVDLEDRGEANDPFGTFITLRSCAKGYAQFTVPLGKLTGWWGYDTDLERLKKAVIKFNIEGKRQEIERCRRRMERLQQSLDKWTAFDPKEVRVEG